MTHPITTSDPVRDAEAWMAHQDQLDAAREARVQGWIDQIWEESLNPIAAEKWAYNLECLINDTPAILEAAAHARRSDDMEYLGRMVMARLDAWVKWAAEFMEKEIGK